jgi:hypothetical protein
MKASLKSFAAFVVTIGISGLRAADTASAADHGSHGGSSPVSSSHPTSHPSSGPSRSQSSRSPHQFDKHDSYKYDHCWDQYGYGHSCYGCYPWNSCYSSFCYPCCRPCYQPCYPPACCEYEPPCCPPCCYQAPCCPPCPQFCYPSCPEYCGSYCFPGCYGRDCWDGCYDYSKDRDYGKHREHPLNTSGSSHDSKSHFSGGPQGNSDTGSTGKMASHTGGMSGGSHGSRR